MITARTWAGKRYGVLGLARSGSATVRALLAAGASVVAWDSDEAKRAVFDHPGEGRGPASDGSQPGPGLRRAGLDIADLEDIDLATLDALVISPGVPLNTHPLAAKARAAGVPIIGDIELFAQARADLPPHKVVGITGTNGKSTTTALVHHILQTAGVPSLMGGNIGLPILEQEPLEPNDRGVGVYVLELSSYQIDLTFSLDCDVAVLTNITPDHLDRYDGFEAYAASKARLFEMQSIGNSAIVCITDQPSFEIGRDLADGVRGHDLYEVRPRADAALQDWPALQGPHNALNTGAAMGACLKLGVNDAVIAEALRTFTGLPHRMERVATLDGVTYVDDSKATNPESAAPALAAFPRVHWILGGLAKSDDLDACAPHFGHVARAYTIGEAGPRFAALLRPHVSVAECGTLPVAVNAAWSAARRGETVLLSPACASFDQFADYAARGLAFRRAVEALPVKEPAA